MPDIDQWGATVVVIAIVLTLIYFNLPRDHEDDEDNRPWV